MNLTTPLNIIRPEWKSQLGVLMTWPHKNSSWKYSLDEINACYLEIAWQICRFEPLHILCYDENLRDTVHQSLTHIGIPEQNLFFYIIKTNDTWIRDYGPIRLDDNDGANYVNFKFNAWGNKYPHELDNKATNVLFQHSPFASKRLRNIDCIVEGGAIDVNGTGLLITNYSSMVNPNRNLNFDKQKIEAILTSSLGVSEIIWVNAARLSGDDTDGHIDTMARFCSNNTIIYNAPHAHANHIKSNFKNEIYNSVQSYNEEHQTKLLLVECPVPTDRNADNLEHTASLPASYVNFFIINDAVLVPRYLHAHDLEAQSIIGNLFPGREIVAIDCTALIKQFGSLHCATMQF